MAGDEVLSSDICGSADRCGLVSQLFALFAAKAPPGGHAGSTSAGKIDPLIRYIRCPTNRWIESTFGEQWPVSHFWSSLNPVYVRCRAATEGFPSAVSIHESILWATNPVSHPIYAASFLYLRRIPARLKVPKPGDSHLARLR
jgi:hypothetical protein